MKKIAIVCHDQHISGANCSLLDYLASVKNTNNIIVILPNRNKNFEKKLNDLNIKFYHLHLFIELKHLRKRSLIRKVKSLIVKIYNLFFKMFFLKRMVRILKKEKITHIISNSVATTYGYKLSEIIKVPHIFHVREFMELDHEFTYNDNVDVNTMYEKSSAVFISNSIKEYYLSKYKFKSFIVLYDSVFLDYEYSKDRNFMQDGKLKLLIAGTLQQNKGQMDAIKACEIVHKKIKDVELFICGHGNDYVKLLDYIKSSKLSYIHLLGQRKDLVDIRKNIDIALVCSKMEALGRVTIEAMFYENFVIGCNSGETAKLLAENRGLTYTFGDYKELANKILQVVKMKGSAELDQIKFNAKNFAKQFNQNNLYEKIIKFIEFAEKE